MYKIFKGPHGSCIIMIDMENKSWFIPEDEMNIDYQNYLTWLAAGNKPEVI